MPRHPILTNADRARIAGIFDEREKVEKELVDLRAQIRERERKLALMPTVITLAREYRCNEFTIERARHRHQYATLHPADRRAAAEASSA